jgi:hypothetical protein
MMMRRLLFPLVQGPTAPLIDGPRTAGNHVLAGLFIKIDSDESSRVILLCFGDQKGQVQPGDHHGAFVHHGSVFVFIYNEVMGHNWSSED